MVKIKNLLFSVKCTINAYLALLIRPFVRSPGADVWLVGGLRGRLYEDNSKVFYEYLIENHPGDPYREVSKNGENMLFAVITKAEKYPFDFLKPSISSKAMT